MPLPQQKFREIVFQLLYSHDMGSDDFEQIVPLIMKELAVTRKAVREAEERMRDVLRKRSEIDTLIAKTSTAYEFERIPSVERNIMRLAIFELLFDSTIPPKVAIAEGLRLAKKFSTPESVAFVNAILDHIYQQSIGLNGAEADIAVATRLLIDSEKLAQEVSLLDPMPIDETQGSE